MKITLLGTLQYTIVGQPIVHAISTPASPMLADLHLAESLSIPIDRLWLCSPSMLLLCAFTTL